jgi:hypothetical protein
MSEIIEYAKYKLSSGIMGYQETINIDCNCNAWWFIVKAAIAGDANLTS